MLGPFKKLSRVVGHLQKKRDPLPQAPPIENKKFLFIGGLHRSGTSILHRLLCEHPLASGFRETGVPEDEGQHLQSVFPAAHEYGGPGEFAFHLDAHLTEDSDLVNPVNRDRLLCQWGAYYDLSRSLLLEKSPPNLVRSRFLRQLFPNSNFLFIVRHPVAVSLATEKWSSKTITERLLHWNTAYSIMLSDIDAARDCMVIRYEDFVAAPERYLDEICDFSGIHRFSPSETVENHNEKYFDDWMRRYESEINALQAVLPADNPLLKRFDYSLSRPFDLKA